jgi:hypothetical protein
MEKRFMRGRGLPGSPGSPSRVRARFSTLCRLSWVAGLLIPLAARSGPVNPDISVIGQPFARITDDPEDADRERLQFEPGEVELVLEGYLNPYAKGLFTLAIGEEGLELEEGYLDLLRGLPLGLALRGGQYRVGFGRQNPVHPHAYPFAERFRVLVAYLPGEEAFIETGISLSKLVALPGDRALTVAADLLQGDSFRIEREAGKSFDDPLADPEGPGDRAEETRLAIAARASAFAPIGEESGIDLGVSVTHGTTNVAADARSTVAGVDCKAKLWRAPDAYLLLQAEGLWMDRPTTAWEDGVGYVASAVDGVGGYFYADYQWARRYNAGLGGEHFEDPAADGTAASSAVRLFTGLSLLEESTSFLLDWERFFPASGAAANTLTLRAVFALGPHKAHPF